jgi:antitoxin component YwqK of YwqJK toxin-antitoxin module
MKLSANLLLFILIVLMGSCDTDKVDSHYDTGELKTKGQISSGINVGTWTDYYRDGKLKAKISYNKQGEAEGECFSWYPNGQLQMKSHYKRGMLEGSIRFWYSNGQLKTEGLMTDGKKDGQWFRYDSLGGKIDTLVFD